MRIWDAALGLSIAGLIVLNVEPLRAATEKVVYSFCSEDACSDGAVPFAGLLRVKDKFYTTTASGGANGHGTLNVVDRKSGSSRVLYSFENFYDDADDPQSGLTDFNGTLFGMTAGGGVGLSGNGAGTIYSLDPKSKTITLLHSFCAKTKCTDGARPVSDLLALNGLLYGTTSFGGKGACMGSYDGCGTVFSFDPLSRNLKVLYNFCKLPTCMDGAVPLANLIAVNGKLYGTASIGGGGNACDDTGRGCGVAFALDPVTGREAVLHNFIGGSDGGVPMAGLLEFGGMLYGTTELGGGGGCDAYGPYGCGTIFSIDPKSGTEKIVHAFAHDGDGEWPEGGLVAMKGKLYGTTYFGGTSKYGTVFSFAPKIGQETVVYSFCGLERCDDGSYPNASLISLNGILYGTTQNGGSGAPDGAMGEGTVFSLVP